MRDVLIHDYINDAELVWHTIQRDLPNLLIAVKQLLSENRSSAAYQKVFVSSR